MHIIDCSFDNCVYKYSSDSGGYNLCGGVIYTENNTKNSQNYIENTCFYNCGLSNNYYYNKGNNAISNCIAIIENCKFKNCWNWYDGQHRKSSNKLFLEGTTNDNNILEDCADFS